MLRSKRARKITALSCVALFILLLGMVAGFFIAKYVGTEYLTTCYEGRPPGNEISKTGLPDGYQRGMPLNVSNLRQLPAPGTPEAQDLLASEDTEASTLSLYQLSTDAEIITEQLTEAFLSQLQVQLSAQASGDTSSPNIFSRSLVPPGTNLTQVLEIFKGVARDILNYFRYHRSEALLPLLRQFSLRGGLAFADVDPDVLRLEIQQLINEGTMNEWYASVNRYDNPAIKTEPPGSSGTLSDQANPAQLLMGSPTAAGGRRLLHSQPVSPPNQQQHSRGLQAAASIPAFTDSTAVADDTIPTVGPLLSLQDMLCLIKPFNPTGLKGLELPGSGGAITCDVNLPVTTYRDGGFVFKPVVIPVVFHCQRYLEGDVLQPPIWEPQTSAQNLIDVTNKLYQGTGIQFALQEVRYDVDKYPYLLLATLNDWQSCTGIPTQESAGFPCIKDTVNFPDVAALAEKLVVNVIVGGSQTAPFCNGTASEVCNSLYLGYCGAMGPWFARPSPTWREGLSEENWIWITWDMFAPSVRNGYRFWNGGAVTLAHELGHYLGLMHTHEGSTPCEGDGLTKADSVPDTPVNLQTEQWAAQKGLVVQLARWCSEFRNSRSPNPKDLLVFNSCQQDNTVDNVFNLLSYTPDACCMIMSPNQVARLQWATTRFRPKMMAQFAAR